MAEVQNGTGADKAAVVAFTAVKPWLVVDAPKASDAVQFYKTAFGAEELSRVMHPKRKADHEIPLVLSAELKLGSAIIVVSDLIEDDSALVKSAGTGVFYLETEEVESALSQAVTAGATAEGEISEGGDGAVGNNTFE